METARHRIAIKRQMSLNFDEVEKPFRKLRKLLKRFPQQPSPKLVHDIRTRTRRVEAAVAALSLDRKPIGKRALKAVTPVRKRAGKVRDMDVLTGFAATLTAEKDDDCLVQLLEHLGKQRFAGTRKLHKTVIRNRSAAAQSLKRCSSSIKRHFKENGEKDWAIEAGATSLELAGELAKWPKLNKDNLHPFRLKVKELRNVLQLSGKDGELVKEMGEVKDAIGEWHDWTELANIATEILGHAQGCEVQTQIRLEIKRRFDKAMALANRVIQQYFEQPRQKNKGARSQPLKEPVLKAAATLAA